MPAGPCRVSSKLATEVANLDHQQQEAVLVDGNLVVRAGPGSGKTRVLVARTGRLLQESTTPFRGVAAITYTNEAAKEIHTRLSALGVNPGPRLATGTVHSFCLSQILRPYARAAGERRDFSSAVLSDAEQKSLFDECIKQTRANHYEAYGQRTRIRRMLAIGELPIGAEPDVVECVRLYEQRLADHDQLDFEAMPIEALRLVRQYPQVADMLRARFPYLLVDEYQDLGGVLHNLVRALHSAGTQVTAVGDSDQTIFGFAGAESRYLDELAGHSDFRHIHLTTNYRSGSAVIAAAEIALQQRRGYRPHHERTDDGVVELRTLNGDLDEHIHTVVNTVSELVHADVPAHEIGVLVRNHKPLADPIADALSALGLQVRREAGERRDHMLTSPLGKWLTDAANHTTWWATPLDPSDIQQPHTPPTTLLQLTDTLDHLQWSAGLPVRAPFLLNLRILRQALLPLRPASQAEISLHRWLESLEGHLDLHTMARNSVDSRNRDDLEYLHNMPAATSLRALSHKADRTDHVTVTTYHNAKGREFTATIMPGLVQGLVPPHRYRRVIRRWTNPQGEDLIAERRAFFVALTRSSKSVLLLAGERFTDHNGRIFAKGRSEFLTELAVHLGCN